MKTLILCRKCPNPVHVLHMEDSDGYIDLRNWIESLLPERIVNGNEAAIAINCSDWAQWTCVMAIKEDISKAFGACLVSNPIQAPWHYKNVSKGSLEKFNKEGSFVDNSLLLHGGNVDYTAQFCCCNHRKDEDIAIYPETRGWYYKNVPQSPAWKEMKKKEYEASLPKEASLNLQGYTIEIGKTQAGLLINIKKGDKTRCLSFDDESLL